MSITQQIAEHFREVHTGGNWTASNLKDNLAGISWEQAVKRVDGLNSIAMLVYHMNYYVEIILNVLQGKPLDGNDRLSFNLPPIQREEDWNNLVQKSFTNAEALAKLIEQLSDEVLAEPFANGKYGNYYRNFAGLIEHTHYHVGQIAVIRKLILSPSPSLNR